MAAARIRVNLSRASTVFKFRGERVVEDGYVLVWDDSRGRYVGEHRLVCEAALGRPLKTDEEVHHCNGERADNRKGNLVVCSPEYHEYLNACMRLRRKKYRSYSRYRAMQRLLVVGFLHSPRRSSSDLHKILSRLDPFKVPPLTASDIRSAVKLWRSGHKRRKFG